jgi:hypothetical protein
VPIALAIAIVVGAVLVAAGVMLLVRRRAPAGGFYSSSRGVGIASAVQGSLGILVAFVIFLAFQNYLEARDAAQDEATAVAQLYRAGGLFEEPTRTQLRDGLACYARAVIGPEWASLDTGTFSPLPDHASNAIDSVFESAAVRQPGPAGQWLAAVAARADAHQRRLSEAQTFVPTLLWVMLAGGAVGLFALLLTFADPTERWPVQALIAALPMAVIVAGLVLVYFFSHPYSGTSGSIEPTAMERTLVRMEQLSVAHREPLRPPCDADGRLTGALQRLPRG